MLAAGKLHFHSFSVPSSSFPVVVLCNPIVVVVSRHVQLLFYCFLFQPSLTREAADKIANQYTELRDQWNVSNETAKVRVIVVCVQFSCLCNAKSARRIALFVIISVFLYCLNCSSIYKLDNASNSTYFGNDDSSGNCSRQGKTEQNYR